MIFNCIRDVWTCLKLRFYLLQRQKSEPLIPWPSKLNLAPTSLSCFLLLLLQLLLLFSLLLFGVSCVLVFFATLHTKLMILWGEAVPERYAAVRCSRGCSQQQPSPGLQLAIITIDLKLYLVSSVLSQLIRSCHILLVRLRDELFVCCPAHLPSPILKL